MARGDALRAGLARRIRESGHELVIHYPPARPTSPDITGAVPVAPLTGSRITPNLVHVPAAPSKEPVTIDCVWFDRTTVVFRGDNRTADQLGWIEPAQALARVLSSDLLVDPEDPALGTHLTGALAIEHNGKRYRVLQTDDISIGSVPAYSYAIWLIGAKQQ